MSIRIFIAWYDFWVGFYYDRKDQTLYVCLIPMVVIAFEFMPYYQIIGGYTGSVIGYCVGPDAVEQVLEEEPRAKLRRIPKQQYMKEAGKP
jgi:hypothetical protein